MKKIICVMGKSGTGKSTIIDYIIKHHKECYMVKSYSNRPIRVNDQNDINTHIFVSKDFEKKNIISLYHDEKNDYENWTDDNSFLENKMNLYAIDSIAFVDLYKNYKDIYDITGIYLYIDEKEREERFFKRGSINFSSEEHLSHEHINKAYIPSVMLNITEKSVTEIANKIMEIIEAKKNEKEN